MKYERMVIYILCESSKQWHKNNNNNTCQFNKFSKISEQNKINDIIKKLAMMLHHAIIDGIISTSNLINHLLHLLITLATYIVHSAFFKVNILSLCVCDCVQLIMTSSSSLISVMLSDVLTITYINLT